MTKDQIVDRIGRERYAAAARHAREQAARPDHGRRTATDDGPAGQVLARVIDEIGDLLWYGSLPHAEALGLLFEIYDDMPAYGHLMRLFWVVDELDPADRDLLIGHVRKRLDRTAPMHVQPLQYSLWCDVFESSERVETWWRALAGPGASERVLRNVLRASGPVPWHLKRATYENLISAPRWHDTILDSLWWSAVDVHGDIDRDEALRLLGRLRLSTEHAEDLETLRSRLESG